VPADKTTPVLSGRLDTDVELAASDLGGDPMMKSLAGKGTVALTQGTLGESTFFTAIGGGSGLGDVGKTLQTLAPAVGQELAGLQRSLSFQSLTSRFEIAKERIDVKESRLTGTSTRIDMTGVVHFDQRVDLATRLWIGSRGGEQLKKVIPDQTLPLRVTGTLEKPKIVHDVKVGDLLKGGLTQLPGNIGEGATDLGKKLEEEAKRLGRGLFGK
jgi:hypothetical protein